MMSARRVKRTLLLLALLLAPQGFAQSAATNPLQKGMNFLKARHLLLHRGWVPVYAYFMAEADATGTERLLFKAHIREVENCAVDAPICIFNYRKGDACLRLFTQGEEIREMTVDRWDNTCPAKPK